MAIRLIEEDVGGLVGQWRTLDPGLRRLGELMLL
jgi:hypothetical protein